MSLTVYDPTATVWNAPAVTSDSNKLKPNFQRPFGGNIAPHAAVGTVPVRIKGAVNIRLLSRSASEIYAEMSPWERLRFNARNRRLDLIASAIGVLAGMYILGRSVMELKTPLSVLFSMAATAQEAAPAQIQYIYSSRMHSIGRSAR